MSTVSSLSADEATVEARRHRMCVCGRRTSLHRELLDERLALQPGEHWVVLCGALERAADSPRASGRHTAIILGACAD